MKAKVTEKLQAKFPGLVQAGVPIGTEVDTPSATLGERCDKSKPTDLHYGEAGYYTSDCVWIPEVRK